MSSRKKKHFDKKHLLTIKNVCVFFCIFLCLYCFFFTRFMVLIKQTKITKKNLNELNKLSPFCSSTQRFLNQT